ncbi:MAG: MotA/TolQ/ExbB proton channel family protein [Candidatus Latescibacterota bacterium]
MIQWFLDGGIFMYPLAIWSVMSLAFFLERVYTYLRMRPEGELSDVTNDMNSRVVSGASLEQLKDHCAQVGRMEGEVYGEGILRFEFLTRETRSMEEMREELNSRVERAASDYLERYLPVLDFVAKSAVLLGLLGTVSGMIHAFEGIAEKGLGEPTIVAAGISEALITTVAGLSISVPTLAVFSYFANRAATKAVEFEPYGHTFVDALLQRWQASRAA